MIPANFVKSLIILFTLSSTLSYGKFLASDVYRQMECKSYSKISKFKLFYRKWFAFKYENEKKTVGSYAWRYFFYEDEFCEENIVFQWISKGNFHQKFPLKQDLIIPINFTTHSYIARARDEDFATKLSKVRFFGIRNWIVNREYSIAGKRLEGHSRFPRPKETLFDIVKMEYMMVRFSAHPAYRKNRRPKKVSNIYYIKEDNS